MLLDEYGENVNTEKKQPQLKNNHAFTQDVFKRIYIGTRHDLKRSALDIRKLCNNIKINNSNELDKILEKAVEEFGGIGMFNSLGEKIFFELHIIFGGDREFSKEFIKYDRNYKKMAEAYHTKTTYVKMRNLIRLLNNKENLKQENIENDLENFIKKL